jgi:hypothetical protein
MLELDDPRWATLSHAYGHAADIPTLIARAGEDTRPGNQSGSTWFDLWSALCHQGDTYTASYAAVPHLVVLAPGHLKRKRYDPLLLTACIELARLEGHGPAIPPELASAYHASIVQAGSLAQTHLTTAWDADSQAAIAASAAALRGDVAGARAILDADLNEGRQA